MLATAFSLTTRQINLGIDFLGGLLVEVKIDTNYRINDIRARLDQLQLGDISVQEFGSTDVLLIRLERQSGGDQAQSEAISKLKQTLETIVLEYRRVETVGPTIGAELREAAIWAVISALLAILIYIWLRFEWQFGLGAILALSHDIWLTLGLFSITGIEFNLASVAAILTIAGYSINDSVVIYDRVRENLRRYRKMTLEDLCNLSINQTLARTLVTSFTTLLALGALALFGGSIIRDFALIMIFGVVIGTWSSIALAIPFLLLLRPQFIDDQDDEENSSTIKNQDGKHK
ncbi:MAG: protein translocase subunit SecF [Pseudomonadota bacterium]